MARIVQSYRLDARHIRYLRDVANAQHTSASAVLRHMLNLAMGMNVSDKDIGDKEGDND